MNNKIFRFVLALTILILSQETTTAQCWYVEDNGGSTPDELCITDPPSCQDITYPDGTTPVTLMEALSIDPTGAPIYGSDGGQLGVLDIPTAVFTPFANPSGYSDIDGLALDPHAGILYATTRNSGLDSILQIYYTGPNAGLPVPGTVVAVSGSGGNVDELTITPINCGTSGTIYASIDKGGGTWVLATINPITGVATEIGTGFGIPDVESISFSGDCELYGNTGAGLLYLIDTISGLAVGDPLIDVPGGDVEGMACDFGPGPFAGSIGGSIFLDNNVNGTNDNEPGIGGVVLNLLDEFGNPVLNPANVPITTTTAADGSYIFANLMGGNYIVQIDSSNIQPSGTLDDQFQTYDEDGGTSNPNLEIPVTIAQAGDHTTADFGYTEYTDIGDTITNDDTNAPIDGVLVYLLDDMGAIIDSATTANGGMYLFDSLTAGNYTFLVDPSNFETGGALENMTNTTDPDGGLDNTSDIVLAAGIDDLDQDYGYSALASIGDTITNDDTNAPIDGVLVYLLDDMGAIIDSAKTANGGMYLFDSLTAGNYTVLVDPSNFETGGTLENMTNTTDPNAGLDNTSDIVLAAGIDDLDQDYGYSALASIGDTITNDDTNAPIDGVLVYLLDDMGAIIDSATTANGGMYLFDSLTAGNYTVLVDPSNFETDGALENMTNTTDPNGGLDNTSDIVLAAGVDDLDQDYGYTQFGSITGSVKDSNGVALGDVELILFDTNGNPVDTVLTLADGTFEFLDVVPGDYNIVETQPAGYRDVSEVDGGADADFPDNGIINNIPVKVGAGEADAGNDFVELLASSSIGDIITDDQSGNGIDGVLIVLYDELGNPIDSTLTQNGGFYLFEGLPADTYSVVVDPSNFVDFGPLAGFDPSTDPQGDNNNLSLFTLADNDANLVDGDFGYTQTPLSVEFLNFRALVNKDIVGLIWTTVIEYNNDYFEVERSINGIDFNVIGRVDGSGTINEQTSYRMDDSSPRSGINFYRIKQVDYDGRVTYSNIRTATFTANIDVKVYPTITSSSLTLQVGVDVNEILITILSMNGSVVKSTALSGSKVIIDVDMLQAGSYILHVRIGSKAYNKKFMKVD